VAEDVLDARRAKATFTAPERPRKVSTALQAYAAMTTSAARGAVRDVGQLKRR
jgi:dihydroxy-acid dehydratase